MKIDDLDRECQRLSGAALARLLGRNRSQVTRWVESGCPKGKNGFVLRDVVGWLLSREAEKRAPDESDEWLARWRKGRALMVEHDLNVRRQEFMPRPEVREVYGMVAGALRRFGERLQRRFGVEAGEMLNAALDEAEGHIHHRFGSNGKAVGPGR